MASVTINGRGSMIITRKDSVQTIEFIHNSPLYKKEKTVAETDKCQLLTGRACEFSAHINKNVYHFGSSNEEINFQCWRGDKIIECESEIFERCDDDCDTVHSHHTNAVDKHKLFINIESIRNGHY